MEQIGVGLIGYGGIARVHASAYRSIPFHYGIPAKLIKIIGVAASNPDSARSAGRELSCEFWTADYHDLLNREDVDLVDICVPNHHHEKIILAAASAGKHIFCEKPLSINVAEGQRIVSGVEKAGVKNQINFNFRHYPAVNRARQLIDTGFLGRIFSFRGCYYRASYIDPYKPLSWRLRKEYSGGGALFDMGSHLIDLVYYLLGDFNSVNASVETLIKERPVAIGSTEMAPVDVDDLVLMQVRLEDQSLGTLEVSRMGTGATNQLKIQVFGEKGALRFTAEDPSWLEVFDTRDPDKPTGGMRGFRKVQTVGRFDGQKAPDWTMAPGFTSTFVEAQYRFLKAIWEDRPVSPTLRDGLHVQEVMEAALRSSEEKRWISLREVR